MPADLRKTPATTASIIQTRDVRSMDKFHHVLEGVAADVKIINVDTDMVIPKSISKPITARPCRGCSEQTLQR